MTKARPKEGPRAPLFYSVLALASSGLVQAQAVDQSSLERCAGLATDEQKLACFESIVSEGRGNAEPDLEPATASEPLAAPAREPAPAVIVEAAPESLAEPLPDVPAAVTAPAAASRAAELPAAAAEPTAASADDFGREHIASDDKTRSETLTATVVDVTKRRHGELVFHLDNGQVWQQLEKRYYPYPRNQSFDITISQGMLDEYQLQVGGEGRKVTVKRVR